MGFGGGLDLACRANLESRIASRVLWRVGGGPYRDEHALYDLVRAIDWKALFAPARTLRVDIAAKRSPLQSLEFATLRVKDAVCDRLRDDTGVRPSIDKRLPDVRVAVYLTDRDATVYVDTSGEPLFKRGYRTRHGRGAAAREPRGGADRAHRLDARRAVPRSDVRQRHDRRGGGADRRGSRAGPCAHVRLPEARVVRRAPRGSG